MSAKQPYALRSTQIQWCRSFGVQDTGHIRPYFQPQGQQVAAVSAFVHVKRHDYYLQHFLNI